MELWDVFDEHRQRTGKQVPRGPVIAEGHFHTVVHLCLFDDLGRMLIQRRAPDKPTWPGQWDFSVGGSVVAGETSAEGVARETREELGIELDPSQLRAAFTFNFPGGFDDFYLVEKPVDLESLAVPNDEVAAVKWARQEEVLALARSGEFIGYRESVLRFVFDFVNYPDIFAVTPQWR